MSIARVIRHLLWKPMGVVRSLESLQASHGIVTNKDVTTAVTGTKDGHPLTVVELANGKIIGDLRMVATAGDFVVNGVQSLLGCTDPQNHYLMRRRRFRLLKRRRGTALLLAAANSDNYYHWLLESIPRWKILQTAEWANYDFVLLHNKPLSFQDEVLDRLGVPTIKRLRCAKNFVHQFERLVVPSMPFPVAEVPAWTCDYVRSLFSEKRTGCEKIYLRRGAGRRRLINEAELEAALVKIGFSSADPTGLTVAEQARLLSSARIVVAPHGAALTNLIFARPGALLFELFHPQHKNRSYLTLAAACGHRYACLDGQAQSDENPGQLNYSVDVPAVVQMIAGLQ